MARGSFRRGSDLYTSMSPTLRLLADSCVEAARKSLAILHALRRRDLIGECLLNPFALDHVTSVPG